MSYADFGQRFFETAVTQERVVEAAGNLAGRPVDFGPLGVGPLGLVKVSATGAVGDPDVARTEGEHVAFRLTIPVALQLTIEIGLDRYRFTAAVRVLLPITARAAEPLRIVIDVEAPKPRAIEVDLQAEGLRASVVQVIGGVEGELKKSVAKFVRREIEKPELQNARIIDVAKALQNLNVTR
jgi:hypothetical protein